MSAKERSVDRQLTNLDLFARRDELCEALRGSEVERRRQDGVPLDAMFLDPVGRGPAQVDFKHGINARDLQTPAEQRIALARCGARGARRIYIDPEALSLERIGWERHRRARPAVVDHLELHAMNEECREGFCELLCFERVAPRAREQRRVCVAQTLGDRLQQDGLGPDLDEHVAAYVQFPKRGDLLAEANRLTHVLSPIARRPHVILHQRAGHVRKQWNGGWCECQTGDDRFHGVEHRVHRARMKCMRHVETLRPDGPGAGPLLQTRHRLIIGRADGLRGRVQRGDLHARRETRVVEERLHGLGGGSQRQHCAAPGQSVHQ